MQVIVCFHQGPYSQHVAIHLRYLSHDLQFDNVWYGARSFVKFLRLDLGV